MAQQKNLSNINDFTEFYNSYKSSIDTAMISITEKSTPYWGPANYSGMTSSDGKPHRLNSVREYLINHKKVYEVCYNYRNTVQLKACRENFPMLETLISAFIYIESKYDNRANLKKPNPGSSFKGLVQIGSGFKSAYPDLSGNVADFSPILTSTRYGMEPPNSVYNAYRSIERVIAFLYNNLATFKRIADGITNSDRKYPLSGWALYLLWNQGIGGGSAIIRAYIKNENAPYTQLGKTIARNIRANPFGGKKEPASVGEWVERLRRQYNIGFYIACNNCIARVFKNTIEASGAKVVGSQISKGNFTCTPLTAADFKIKPGSFVRK
jgi:hypothetical protein